MTDVTVTVLEPSTELRLHRLTGAFLAGYRNANTRTSYLQQLQPLVRQQRLTGGGPLLYANGALHEQLARKAFLGASTEQEGLFSTRS